MEASEELLLLPIRSPRPSLGSLTLHASRLLKLVCELFIRHVCPLGLRLQLRMPLGLLIVVDSSFDVYSGIPATNGPSRALFRRKVGIRACENARFCMESKDVNHGIARCGQWWRTGQDIWCVQHVKPQLTRDFQKRYAGQPELKIP